MFSAIPLDKIFTTDPSDRYLNDDTCNMELLDLIDYGSKEQKWVKINFEGNR